MSTLTNGELEQLNKYFDLTNYLAVGQLYLLDNPLLKKDLTLEDIKPRLVGHWGTVPGQNFIFEHLNRAITKYNLNMMYIVGPGHGGQAAVTNAYLDGTYTEVYPTITKNEEGLKKLFKQFSFPGGISSHVAPETPGSIHEGGELGYSLSHALGAVLDNPSLICATIVGDGEAETGPLATSWNINKFINPRTDGTVLPILHLNGFKISNPTVLGRISHIELNSLFKGYGWDPVFVEGSDISEMQEQMAVAMDYAISKINKIKEESKSQNTIETIKWPMIILRTPKGWTGPKEVEGSFKAHQIPLQVDESNEDNLQKLSIWLKKYHPENLFNEDGSIKEDIISFLPKGNQRLSANPVSNGGLLRQELRLPDIQKFMLDTHHGNIEAQDMTELGKYLKEVFILNESNHNFRLYGPDEAMSNRLNYAFDATNRQWMLPIKEQDEHMSTYGRIMDSYLSEHVCEGALEGYLLTGRHGMFVSYEAFLRVVDSMVGQFAKWVKISRDLTWRKTVSSLNIIATSHIWQQDHNGYTHQDPGFINHILNKKRDMVNVYLPYDSNSLIYTVDKCLKTTNQINTIIASKHPRPQWLDYEDTVKQCEDGIGIFKFASDENPDIVLGCAGDTPTLEVLAATSILRKNGIKVRVVNLIDLLKLENIEEEKFNELFTVDKPIIFNFHGYTNVIEELIYRRKHRFDIIHGYEEEGTITTPFDMRVINSIDRYHLVIDALDLLNSTNKELKQSCIDSLDRHNKMIRETGKELPEVDNWKWID